jgi:hypothetical protein
MYNRTINLCVIQLPNYIATMNELLEGSKE